jgi:enoyl-CoA hydratase
LIRPNLRRTVAAMSDTLSVRSADHVAVVTLERPTMTTAFFGEIEAAFRALAGGTDVRAVIVRGAGKAFSYGLDLPAAFQELGPYFAGGTAGVRMELLAYIRKLQASFDAVAACPVPVIAAVHGWCIGGGLDLISACDLRLATEDAKFSLRETKIAIVADLGSLQRLPRLIGQGHTRELAFTGKDITAARAREIGLVNHVYATQEALFEAAEAMSREIAHNSPIVVRGVKEVLDAGEGKSVAEGLAYVAAWNAAFLASEDLGEALSAFMEKRPPSFKGR